MTQPIVLAAAAHPDDIEFMMAGTLLLLKQAVQVHMWNLATGNCGTAHESREEIVRRRWEESEASAAAAGATLHAPLFDDLGIFYDQPSLARVAAVIRDIRPTIVLTHSPQDYMEDHQNACRLVMSATFARGMRNFETAPPWPPYDAAVAVYHALPYGLRDPLRNLVEPDGFVDITAVLPQKREMLAQHRSQQEWLDISQGINAYLSEMESMSRQVGRMSGRFEYAEGWRRRLHLGFASETYHPLAELLGPSYLERDA